MQWLTRTKKNLVRLGPLQKQLVILPIDAAVVVVCLWLSLAVRLGSAGLDTFRGPGFWLLVIIPPIALMLMRQLGVYRVSLRSLERRGVGRIAQASALTSLVLAAASTYFPHVLIPRSTPIIFALMMFVLLIAVRVVGRDAYTWIIQTGIARSPVVIYGAGAGGTQLASSIANASEYRVVGFLDDDSKLWGRLVAGHKVSPPADLDKLLQRFGVKDVLLALPSISPSRRSEILRFLSERPVHVRTVPSLAELLTGTAGFETLLEIDIDDLLGRDQVEPLNNLFQTVVGKNVLVTGAGGSIGSELCRQAAARGARSIILFELSELALYQIEAELRSAFPQIAIRPVLGSVTNKDLLKRTLLEHRVQTLFHAAAYKHVPLVEQNAVEGLRNNTFGTLCVAEAALEAKVDRAVLISTDKAVRPTNVMGASKRLAERVFGAHQERTSDTVFCMVRFGNVIGSSGSVIPLFKQQIASGGPVTVTDPQINRYFMTIPEAAQLVIQASGMSTGGDLFLLDMGEPVSILDLARRMIRLAGARLKAADNDGGIEIVFTGLRPGEKLYEELLIDAEAYVTQHPKIFRAIDAQGASSITDIMKDLKTIMDQRDEVALETILSRHVEGYKKTPQPDNQIN